MYIFLKTKHVELYQFKKKLKNTTIKNREKPPLMNSKRKLLHFNEARSMCELFNAKRSWTNMPEFLKTLFEPAKQIESFEHQTTFETRYRATVRFSKARTIIQTIKNTRLFNITTSPTQQSQVRVPVYDDGTGKAGYVR